LKRKQLEIDDLSFTPKKQENKEQKIFKDYRIGKYSHET
jgi:hypothetical protein